MRIAYEPPVGDFQFTLYAADGTTSILRTETNLPSGSFRTRSLEKGDYFLQFNGRGSRTGRTYYYSANLVAAATVDGESEPNDSSNTADLLDLDERATGHISFTRDRGVIDNQDYWNFTVPGSGTQGVLMTLYHDPEESDFQFSILDSNLDKVTGTETNAPSPRTLNFTVEPGEYFLLIDGRGSQIGRTYYSVALIYDPALGTPTPTPTPIENQFPPTLESAEIIIDEMNGDLLAIGIGFNDPDGNPSGFIYQWFINGMEVAGVAGERLTALNFMPGDIVTVFVFPFDGVFTGEERVASITIGSIAYRLEMTPEEMVLRPGEGDLFVVKFIPELPVEQEITFTIISDPIPGVELALEPGRIQLDPGKTTAFTKLFVVATNAAQEGTYAIEVEGISEGIIAQLSGTLRINEDPFQEIVTINAERSIVEVGETIVLFGQAVSSDEPGFVVSIVEETSGREFIVEDINAFNEYRFLYEPTDPGELRFFLQAGVPDDFISIFLVSRTITVQVIQNEQPQLVLATNAQGDESQGDMIQIFGELGTVFPDDDIPEIELTITQEQLNKNKAGKRLFTMLQQEMVNVPVEADGSFSTQAEVALNDGRLNFAAMWPGDARNVAVNSQSLSLPLGAARIDERAIFIAGTVRTEESSFNAIFQLATQVFTGRGFESDKQATIATASSSIAAVSAEVQKVKDAEQTLLYIVGKGSDEGVVLGDDTVLTPELLAEYIAQVTGTLVIVIEADNSGIFTGPLTTSTPSDRRRVIITSTDTKGKAIFAGGGLFSFSGSFFLSD